MNVADLQACRHEALHVVAALEFGWPIRGVIRRVDASGESYVTPLTNGNLHERAVQAGVILIAPFLDGCTPTGCGGDLKLLSALTASGARLVPIWDRATELLADPGFRRRVRVLEFALYSRPVMSGAEVALLLEEQLDGGLAVRRGLPVHPQ